MSGSKPTKTTKPKKPKVSPAKESIKIATSNLFVTDSNIPSYVSFDELVLQELNAGEIMDYVDNSIFLSTGEVKAININGNAIVSNITKSFSTISKPSSVLLSTNYKTQYRNRYQINLQDYVPTVGQGDGGAIVFMDESNNLIINTVNVDDTQEVEIEFWRYNVEINDTIIE